jgi:hypothetical protein
MKTFFLLLAALVGSSGLLFGQMTFQSVSRDGAVITFTWSSVSGMVYQVQYNTNLNSGVWTNLGSPILATSSTANATDTIGPDMARFYRLTAQVDSNTAPPMIVITEPLNNAFFIASSTNIIIRAAATATMGNPEVQFFQGTTSLGVLTNPPYNLVWSNATAGHYVITAVATADGLSTTSAIVNVTVTPLFAAGNLLLWLKADGIAGLTNYAPVAVWNDCSGSGNDAIQQVSASSQPMFVTNIINGLPIIRFNGTSSYFYFAQLSLFETTGADAFVVLNVPTAHPSGHRTLWRFGSSLDFNLAYPNQYGQIVEDFGSTSSYTSAVPVQPLTQFHLYEVAASTGNNSDFNWTDWINGHLLTTALIMNSYGTLAIPYDLGCDTLNGPKDYFAGDIAEVLIFNRKLTATERDVAGAYLWSKYNLSQYAASTAPPSAPASPIAVGLAPNQLELQWSAYLVDATTYSIERKLGTNGIYLEIGSVSPPRYNFLDFTGNPTNQYFYRIRAHNLFGDAYSTEISPPTIAITNYSPFALENLPHILGAQAGDVYGSVSNVQFFANNISAGSVKSAPYSVSWIPIYSQYILKALAKDSLGNSQYSVPVKVLVSLDSNGDNIPDYVQVLQGNDPLNPWTPAVSDANPLNITLMIPTNAIIVP